MASSLCLSVAPKATCPQLLRVREVRPVARTQRLQRRRCLRVAAEVSSREAETVSSPPPPPKKGDGVLQRDAPELEEKFAILDSGKWSCNSCGYVYDQAKGDPNYPISPGLEFKQLPSDWLCPTCGAAPSNFQSLGREVAGFAQNQSYGLGTNAMTAGQKSALIWGSLGFFFFLFMGGYFLE